MERRGVGRYITCIAILLVIFSLFGLQLINWQIVNGAAYREVADKSSSYTITTEPARGEILDVNGVDLAINITGYKIVFDMLYMPAESQNDIIVKMVGLMDRLEQEWVDELPIVVTEDGGYAFVEGQEDEIEALRSTARLQSYATAEDCINRLAAEDNYDCAEYSAQEKRDIISVRYNMVKTGYNYETPYTFAESITQEAATIVMENSQKLPGVSVEDVPTRKYVNGAIAPNIVGYIGAIDEDEYNQKKEEGKEYALNAKIGKSGIELAYEDQLRGTEGSRTVERSPDGSVISETENTPAVAGNTVYLTIDARLQQVASEALRASVEAARKTNPDNTISGAVVALNVKDFSVLCAQSYPSYDMGLFMEDDDYRQQILSDDVNSPMYDRVFMGGYAPGSIMKPAVALAALQEGAINANTTFNCTGALTDFGPQYVTRCMHVHGNVSLLEAMAGSCNVYFMRTGLATGITNLNNYQRRLGFGVPTGVEIAEYTGILAGPDERDPWLDGNTVQASIGQSDDALTPIQMATYCATIANDGVRLRTHLVSKVTDYSRQNVLEEYNADNIEVMADAGISPENMQLVQESMRNVITSPSGTAYSYFQNYGVAVAAKTGTAENTGGDHTTFMAYAPYDDPEIAVAVIIEHGERGTYSSSVAKAIFDAYFGFTEMPEIPETNPDGTVGGDASSAAADSSAAQ